MGRPLTINMHLAAWESPFSWNADMINLRGLVVILVLLLISSSTEKIIWVFSKEGWIIWEQLMLFIQMKGGRPSDYVMFSGFLIQLTFIVISFFLEHAASKGAKILPYVYLNMIMLTILPVIYVILMNTHVLFNCMYILNVCIVWFKLISYHHVLNDVWHQIAKA